VDVCKWITLKGFTEELCGTRLCFEQLRPAEVEQMDWDPINGKHFINASDVGESWRRSGPLSVPMCMPHVRGDGLDLHALTKDAIGAHDGAVHLQRDWSKSPAVCAFQRFYSVRLPSKQSRAEQSNATHGRDYDYVRRGW
jgi:hypothetical protein